MKSVSRFLRGPFRNAVKLFFEEVLASDQEARQERGWKVLMNVSALPSRRWSQIWEQIDVTVRSILERGVVQLD